MVEIREMCAQEKDPSEGLGRVAGVRVDRVGRGLLPHRRARHASPARRAVVEMRVVLAGVRHGTRILTGGLGRRVKLELRDADMV